MFRGALALFCSPHHCGERSRCERVTSAHRSDSGGLPASIRTGLGPHCGYRATCRYASRRVRQVDLRGRFGG